MTGRSSSLDADLYDTVPLWTTGDWRLDGGFDGGAELVGGTARRTAGPCTASVHLLLAHMAAVGFTGAPQPLGFDDRGRARLTISKARRPDRPAQGPHGLTSIRRSQALRWLRQYRHAVNDFVPQPMRCGTKAGPWKPGLIVAHNDAAPHNAVWDASGLLGFG